MLLLRVLAIVRWPLLLVWRLLRGVGRLVRGGGGAKAASTTGGALAAPAVGVVGLMHGDPEPHVVDVYHTVFFKRFTCPPSDEPDLGPNDLDLAIKMRERARKYYKLRPNLFPPDNLFYEEVEQRFIDEVCRIDNDGGEDQFVQTLDEARRVTNDNTRALYCELAPSLLLLLLLAVGLALIFDPLGLLSQDGVWSPTRVANNLALGAGATTAAAILMLAIYRFSYTHVQRENALSLDNFITTEFARLNNQYRVAQRESLQAETQLSDQQRDEIKNRATAWALAFHWIGVRQFMEEMVVRNTMFQIRRNTTLYVALGVVLCLLDFAVILALLILLAGLLDAAEARGAIMLQLPSLSLLYLVLVYGLATRKSFAIIVASLRKDEWNRIDTLDIGEAIAEQVSRDKVQIVINRDRARAGSF